MRIAYLEMEYQPDLSDRDQDTPNRARHLGDTRCRAGDQGAGWQGGPRAHPIRDAAFRDCHSVLLTDCTSEPIGKDAPRSNDASILVIEVLFGWTSTSRQFLEAFDKG